MEKNLDNETLLMLLDPRSPLKGRSPPPFAKMANLKNKNMLAPVPSHHISLESHKDRDVLANNEAGRVQ